MWKILKQIDKIFGDINNWFKINQLVLNYNKTHYLQFSVKNGKDHDLKLNYQGNYIKSSTNTKFLGLIIDDSRVCVLGGSDGAASGFAGTLLGWLGGLPLSCRLFSSKYAGFTLSADTVISRPRTTILSVLLVRASTLCGPLYGGSRARRMVSCRRKTCVESCRFLGMHAVLPGLGVVGSCGGGAAE